MVKAVMFASQASRLRFAPQDGMKVIVRGRVSVYEASGQYQLYIDDMQPDGVGALNVAFEQRKAKLAAEGLFNLEHKSQSPHTQSGLGSLPPRLGLSSMISSMCWSAGIQRQKLFLHRYWCRAMELRPKL